MATVINMPKLGLSMVEGTVVEWLKKEGDPVTRGEPVVVVQTEKISNEITAEESGVLLKIITQVNESCPVTAPMGIIGAAGEEINLDDFLGSVELTEAILPSGFDAQTTKSYARISTGQSAGLAAERSAEGSAAGQSIPEEQAAPVEGRLKISPIARRLIDEHRLTAGSIQGTGPGGRITKEDVMTAVREQEQKMSGGVTAATGQERRAAGQVAGKAPTVRPLGSSMRKMIAQNMVASERTAAKAMIGVEADVSRLVEFRQELLREAGLRGVAVRITYTDIIIKAVAGVLLQMPVIRTIIQDDQLVTFNNIDISLAVQLGEDGLVVPVIRDCETKSILEIAVERERLIAASRGGQLTVDQSVGGCFTITNMGGVHELDWAVPVINQPQSAILGTGSIKKKPVVRDDAVVIASTMNLFMSIDHRVIDGEPAVRFLNQVKRILEHPAVGLVLS